MPAPRITGLLATNVFLSGTAFAAVNPYRAIVGVEELGLTNATFAAVMAINAVVGALTAILLGWISDRLGDRRLPILLCAIVGAIAFTLVWAIRTPLTFMLVFCLLTPFGHALFSQTFSYSRAWFDRARPGRSELAMSFLRSMFTLAWIVMPPLAGWIAAETSAWSVFAIAALAHVGATLVMGLLLAQPAARIGRPPRNKDGSITELPQVHIPRDRRIGIAGITFGLIALQLNITVLPLVIVRDLGGTLAQVGITAAVAAAIEMPLMIGWGYIALRLRKETILAFAIAVFAIYLGLMSVAASFLQVLLLQGLAAIAIAALLSINISYLQEAIPGRVGLSTSLVDVTHVIAALVAAGIFAFNPGVTYAPLMAVAAAGCLLGSGLMLLARRGAPTAGPA